MGPIGYCMPSLGPKVKQPRCVVGRPMGPMAPASPREGVDIDGVGREDDAG